MLKSIAGHASVIYGVQFSSDDKLLLRYGRDRSARIWNVDDGKAVRLFMHPHEVQAAIFLLDGKQVVTACLDGQIRTFNADSGELVNAQTLLSPDSPNPGIYEAVITSRDGKLLAAGDDAKIKIWKTGVWEPVAVLERHAGYTLGLTFSNDAKTLISSDVTASVHVWNVPTKTQRLTFSLLPEMQFGAGELCALAVAPDSKLLATASGDNHAELRARITGEVLRTLATDGAVLAVAFSPSGGTLATAGDGLCLWDVSRGEISARLAPPAVKVKFVAWSPGGALLATGDADKSVRIWNATAQKETAVLTGHTAEVHSLAFTPDSKQIISGSSDATARVWDAEKRALIGTLTGHAGAVRAVAVSPDGATIATAGDDNLVRLFGAANFNLQRTLKGHQKPVTYLAFSPQGRTLASGGKGGGILLWDPDRGIARRTLNGHSDSVTGISFLPDASALISGSLDRTIRLWKGTTGTAAQ